ncbi:spore cortex-lytic enzyme [Novibacillus thermophilus]|uniref:Spore cortex-lytic enzyme n=1 Tax=Novibacillus thermophilus TaxID=1471761 RepID=A0A1U9K4F8_9BACL|nr:spore cortex-lytic enzyme [Novibacillus thermophilus]
MDKRKVVSSLLLGIFLTACFLGVYVNTNVESASAFGDEVLKVGAEGGDVYELQGRLKLLGFYTGKVDGLFGWRTYWATRHFQYEFGLNVDGVVGPKTKLKLWQATKHWRPKEHEVPPEKRWNAPQTNQQQEQQQQQPKKTVLENSAGFSANDIRLMANAVYGESRGEPYIGKVAVAAVILNRLESELFPNSPSEVIFEPGAFTAVADGQIWLTPDDEAVKAVRDAINGWDPTDGALYYYNPAKTTNSWIYNRPVIKRIGKHVFAK